MNRTAFGGLFVLLPKTQKLRVRGRRVITYVVFSAQPTTSVLYAAISWLIFNIVFILVHALTSLCLPIL